MKFHFGTTTKGTKETKLSGRVSNCDVTNIIRQGPWKGAGWANNGAIGLVESGNLFWMCSRRYWVLRRERVLFEHTTLLAMPTLWPWVGTRNCERSSMACHVLIQAARTSLVFLLFYIKSGSSVSLRSGRSARQCSIADFHAVFVITLLRKRNAATCEKKISRTYDLLSRTYDLLSRTYDLICRTYDLLSRTYDISSIYTASIMAHRVVNYVKSEADNPSVFLLRVKQRNILKLLHIFFKHFQTFGIPRSYLTSLSLNRKRIWHISCNTVPESGSWKEGRRPKTQITSP